MDTSTSSPPPASGANRSPSRQLRRSATPICSALYCAMRSAAGEMSVAVTCQDGRRCANVQAMAPLPVPMSAARSTVPAGQRRSASATIASTSSSVSGRGISTSGDTANGRP
ncbi:hypothetical protein ABD76_17820 [Paenibacillus dendritiformis]|nr:hypothetical protein [Paenibacillus dendritiformis]